MTRPRVVIVGAGFAGLYAARSLRSARVDVIVIDRRNHHVFQPFLYQVATAALNPSDIAAPIRRILRRQKNASVILGEATSVDLAQKRLILSDGDVPYDYLIVASGATTHYFGHPDWVPYAPGLKDIEDALEIRRKIFFAFEAAEKETDPVKQSHWLTFVVVGGGPTGVELAGALAEISRHTLAKDFRNIDPASARILLIEAADRLLGQFDQRLSLRARQSLEKLGVEVLTGTTVQTISAGSVTTATGVIESETVIWAAGVRASGLGATLQTPVDRSGRVQVSEDLSLPGYPEVFVIGDLAHLTSNGDPVPGVAPAAIQMGIHAARNLVASLDARQRSPFRYRDKGMLAAIGRASAVASLPHLKIWGFLAWITWLAVHIFYLIGFRNRLLVIIQWAWAYATYDRGARLITGDQSDQGAAAGEVRESSV